MTPPHLAPEVVGSGATARLARFVVQCRLEDVPAAVLHEAKRTLLNHFAAAYGGWRPALVASLREQISPSPAKRRRVLTR